MSAVDNRPTGWYLPFMVKRPSIDVRQRLLEAAVDLIRRQGFAATSIDQLCKAAGTTKGGFFHHFASKEALGLAAAQHWQVITEPMFASADYRRHADARARLLGYLDFRETMLDGDFTCLAGMLASEVHLSHPTVARAARDAMEGHAATLETDLVEALGDVPEAEALAHDLALHMQVVLQGAFVLAKAQGDPVAARRSVRHLKSYIAMVCDGKSAEGRGTEADLAADRR